MNAKEILLIKDYLKGAYPILKDSDNSNTVWADMLSGYEYLGVLQALKNHIRSGNKYAPTIAELISGYELILDGFNSDIIDKMTRAREFDDQESVKLHDGRVIAIDPEVSAWNRNNRIEKAKNWLALGIMPDWFRTKFEQYKKVITERYFGRRAERLELSDNDIRT